MRLLSLHLDATGLTLDSLGVRDRSDELSAAIWGWLTAL